MAAFYHEGAVGQLNIKDDALIAEARELAALLGTTATGAVREAVHERLAREKAGREEARQRKIAAIMAIAERVSAMVPEHLRTSDHSDLYDDNGLPR